MSLSNAKIVSGFLVYPIYSNQSWGFMMKHREDTGKCQVPFINSWFEHLSKRSVVNDYTDYKTAPADQGLSNVY